MSPIDDFRLNRSKMSAWLAGLMDHPALTACLYLPPGETAASLRKSLPATLEIAGAPPKLAETIAASPTGAAVFYGPAEGYLVIPPFPIPERRTAKAGLAQPLCGLLEREFNIALVVIHLGSYAIGLFHDGKLTASKAGTGNVHSRHRQGGSSAHRFERHRDKQIEAFFTRVCAHTREILEPHLAHLDYVIYGGTKETLLAFREQCHFTAKLKDHVLDVPLDVRQPGNATLLTAVDRVWSSRIVHWDSGSEPKPVL